LPRGEGSAKKPQSQTPLLREKERHGASRDAVPQWTITVKIETSGNHDPAIRPEGERGKRGPVKNEESPEKKEWS